MQPRLTLLARVAYGAKNGFAHIAAALEREGLLGREVEIRFTEDPLADAAREEGRGRGGCDALRPLHPCIPGAGG